MADEKTAHPKSKAEEAPWVERNPNYAVSGVTDDGTDEKAGHPPANAINHPLPPSDSEEASWLAATAEKRAAEEHRDDDIKALLKDRDVEARAGNAKGVAELDARLRNLGHYPPAPPQVEHRG